MESFTVALCAASRVPQLSRRKVYRRFLVIFLSSLTIVVALSLNFTYTANASEPLKTQVNMDSRIQELIPDIERYVVNGMKAFDIPGLAIGIVANDRLVYAKGFGVRSKNNRLPVDARTGKLNLLRLSTQDGQAFEFRRE